MPIKPVSGEIKSQDINDNLSYLDSKASSMIGGPKETFTSVTALQAKYPSGDSHAMLVTDTSGANGYLYTWDGNSWVKGPLYQAQGIANNVVNRPKLTDQYDAFSFVANQNANDLIASGTHVVNETTTNLPAGITSGIMVVKRNGNWAHQELSDIFNPEIKRYRSGQLISGVWNWNSWKQHVTDSLADNTVSRTKLTQQYDAFSFVANVDLNTLVSSGTQVIDATATNRPTEIVTTGLLSVKRSAQWAHQELADIHEPSKKVYRRGQLINGIWNWNQWKADISGKKLAGKMIVNFGDSLFGNTQDYTNVSSRIAEKTGATVINAGFGGCQMAAAAENWDAFSMYRLVDEIVKEDDDVSKWQYQDEAINNSAWNSRPWYFASTVSKLKAIDFNAVDFVTIAYGTNDFTASVPLDNAEDRQDTSNFAGALRYSLDKIMSKYPHIKILVCGQCYRFWLTETGEVWIDSDDYSISGNRLVEFVRKTEEIATIDFKTPFLDNYFGLGINRSNLRYYFPATDGTHHNADGRKRLGERIGAFLESTF